MKKPTPEEARAMGFEMIPPARARRLRIAERNAAELLDEILALQGVEEESKAQLKQDIFVLLQTGFKRNGFFVEFGATNGLDLSNTWLLEKAFAWNGILAEPARTWHADLYKNRSASIETNCVWRTSNEELEFNMTPDPEFSTIDTFSTSDGHSVKREEGSRYTVQTISLLDLLEKHNAPEEIDYISVDTEGSEYEILEAFDFSKYRVNIFGIEHNYTPARKKIRALMTAQGYERKYEGLSKWDDWYVRVE